MADNGDFVPIELPSEIVAQMPPNLTFMEKREWLKKKSVEFQAQQEQRAVPPAQAESAESISDESSVQTEDTGTADISVSKNIKQNRSQKRKTSQKKSKNANKSLSDDDDDGLTSVRRVPKNIFVALKRVFPQAKSNIDLMAAVTYIFTNGGCEISSSAMELVESYESDNVMMDVLERLARMNQAIRSLDERTSAIELCVCYDTFDRRYGAKERRKSPRENEFREQGSLDMLYRLRMQAKDQRKEDDIERGRSIYEQIKDKNDKND